ncbi:lipoprotein-releasing ABC transporter permease subunit [Biformimicrobium ophioploci]|uniref:Lipoprotein-releasing ABC transporter permease subunit n=1 Tax=Biformimicrobium ophioploci TaxID=3036711 RepID=A0ABQ6M1L4_9GAMM|nr:lipoprotein-releasing ABC transporter permease subunit [Microbulbifer sp. NKW57]GMG88186.1 lipoprotein-releasing ABC transporter permease subunit [Microbulbifer sp. NKW57]
MFRPLPAYIGLRYASGRRGDDSGALVSFISGLSMVGLILGVALMIVVMSIMNGFDRELRERILGIMPHATIYNRTDDVDWPDLRQVMLAKSAITGAAEVWQVNALARKGREVTPLLVQGVNPETITTVSSIAEHLPGGALAGLSADGAEAQIILGKGLADALGINAGERLTIVVPDTSRTGGRAAARLAGFRVLEVFHSGTALDQSLALVAWGEARALAGGQGGAGMQLRFDEMLQANQLLREALRDYSGTGFYGADWTRTHGNLYQAIQMSRNLVSLLVLLIIGIAAFNVVSTLVMVVIDKQGDIAILRTMGVTTSQILKTFVVQGALVGAVGSVIGAVLGVIASLGVTDLVALVERMLSVKFLTSDVYPVDYLPAELHWADVLLVTVAGFLLSLVATIYPATKASRVEPAVALRHE